MAKTHHVLVRALILYLAALPFLSLPAAAQRAPQTIVETPLPGDPRVPGDPPPPDGDETVFTAAAEPLTLRAFNGFTSDTVPGVFSHHGHGHGGGIAVVDSPWGERLELRYWRTPQGLTFEYDGDLKVRYVLDENGAIEEIVAETPEQTATMAVGNRAELAYRGRLDFSDFDLSAYELIGDALRAKHSEAFIDGLGKFNATAKASCATQAIQCGACILSWAASVGAIAAACTVGGVPTFGFACFVAILAHEATNFACAATCIAWHQDCFRTRPPGGQPIPDGCEY